MHPLARHDPQRPGNPLCAHKWQRANTYPGWKCLACTGERGPTFKPYQIYLKKDPTKAK